MRVYQNAIEMIGKTPMLQLHRFDTGPCELFLKLEYANPGGSIKDRIGLSMIEQAEKRGELKPGGTIGGLAAFFKKTAPHVELVLADPQGSILAEYIATGKMTQKGSWLVEGIGEDFIPSICDFSLTKRAYSIPDAESFSVARELLQKEAILAGSSTGTLLAAALRFCREQTKPKRVVTFACDTGARYLSKLFNDFWMEDQGFIEREKFGDLRDLIGRPHGERATITVGPNDVVTTAHNRLRNAGFSQLPVMDNDHLIGVVTEDDILRFAFGRPERFKEPVRNAMTATFLRVDKTLTINNLVAMLDVVSS